MLFDIEKYIPVEEEAYLFDTNVWLYLYSPVTQYNYYIVEIFSRFMHKCLDCNSKIYVTSLIISEFYNTIMRIEYKSKHHDMYKREFRDTQALGDDIHSIIKYCILSKAQKLNDSFDEIDDNSFNGMYDFNDYYLVQLCKKHNIKIVTNDSDFKKFSKDVDIITLNSNYVESMNIIKE